MPTYTANSDTTTDAATGVQVTTGGGNLAGNRLLFYPRGWVLTPGASSDVIGHASGSDPGIYTTGQLQCISVVVATFGQGTWDAYLAHVSHPNHRKLRTLDDLVDGSSYIAIGARAGSIKWMNTIRDRFSLITPNIWIYVGRDNTSPDFGMDCRGFFGETVSWVPGDTPRRARASSIVIGQ